MYEEGLVRFATEPYQQPKDSNISNLYMHLTNFAINKNNKKFIWNKDANNDGVGHKKSLSHILNYLMEIYGRPRIEKLVDEMKEIIVKTLCTAQPILAHNYKSCQADDYENSMCFELLG
jgi:tubulin polyglutamylase TTLL6/13